MNETAMIARFKAQCPSNSSVLLGIGDDAAVIAAEAASQLVCTDMLLDGVHFHLDQTDPRLIGHKALAVNLSDIAAMGGQPLTAFVALALPRPLCQASFLDPLYAGIEELAQRYGVAVAGGDTNVWDGPFVISITVCGRAHSKGAITRAGAQEGDWIFVSGPLGDSFASGHHLNFQPRLELSRQLMDGFDLHAMIDVSDGLGKDLRVVCEQSQLQARLQAAQIPLRAGLLELPRQLALGRALSDGEDFELCFTLGPEQAASLLAAKQLPPCYPIGRMSAGSGLVWDDAAAGYPPIVARGYEHSV